MVPKASWLHWSSPKDLRQVLEVALWVLRQPQQLGGWIWPGLRTYPATEIPQITVAVLAPGGGDGVEAGTQICLKVVASVFVGSKLLGSVWFLHDSAASAGSVCCQLLRKFCCGEVTQVFGDDNSGPFSRATLPGSAGRHSRAAGRSAGALATGREGKLMPALGGFPLRCPQLSRSACRSAPPPGRACSWAQRCSQRRPAA